MAEYTSFNPEGLVLKYAGRVARKLNKLVDDGHDVTAFSIAIILALIKDSGDVALTFSVFGITPPLGFFWSLFINTILTLFLFRKGWTFFKKTRIKIIWFAITFFFDGLPLFSALPLTTIFTFIAWHDVRKKAKRAKEDLETLRDKTMEELEEIEKETLVADEETEELSEPFQERVYRAESEEQSAETESAGVGLAEKVVKKEVSEEAFGMPKEAEEEAMSRSFEETTDKVEERKNDLYEPRDKFVEKPRIKIAQKNIVASTSKEPGKGDGNNDAQERPFAAPKEAEEKAVDGKDVSAEELGGAYAEEAKIKRGLEEVDADEATNTVNLKRTT